MERKCIVSECSNTSWTVPAKLMFPVPRNECRRQQWFAAARRKPFKRMAYCCEDHFVLSEDVANWEVATQRPVPFKLCKSVLPHLNLSSPRIRTDRSQISDSVMRRRSLPWVVPSSTVVKAEPIETEITIKSEPPEFDTHQDDLANVENLGYTHDVEILPGSIKREEDHQYSVRMPSPPKRRKNGSADIEDGLGESEGGKMETARRNHKRRKNSESALPLETEITIEIKTEIKSEPPEFETVDPLENYEESA